MKTITCDVCQTIVETPVAGRNYHHIGNRDVCEACNDKLEYMLKPTVRTKQPFNYEWYARLVQESIEKGIQKGKFEVKSTV